MIENDDVENQIKELKEKIDLEIIKNEPNDQDLCDWIAKILELIPSSSKRNDDDVSMFYIEEIRTMCNVLKSNCSDEAKAYYKEILKLFISLDDYENNTISDMLNSVGIHLEQEQEQEESLLAGDATYDE